MPIETTLHNLCRSIDAEIIIRWGLQWNRGNHNHYRELMTRAILIVIFPHLNLLLAELWVVYIKVVSPTKQKKCPQFIALQASCRIECELSRVELFIIWKLNNNNNRKEIPRLFYLKKKRENFRGKKLKAQKERKS